jgi:F-box and WD-40 domain protein 1/11
MAGNSAFPLPSYLQAFRPTSAMHANRFDEGYSEDTRSQSGSDMLMRTDSQLGDEGMVQELQYALPDEVMQMDESERSGMFRPQ